MPIKYRKFRKGATSTVSTPAPKKIEFSTGSTTQGGDPNNATVLKSVSGHIVHKASDSSPTWWKNLSINARKKYLKTHPNSSMHKFGAILYARKGRKSRMKIM